MSTENSSPGTRTPFPPLYWLTVMFEFFERGSYYGVMSVLSVYLTDQLHFSKQDVGIIKSTIQPLLYFLPIIAGALADRFGYRRVLLVAFSLLGSGYFLTSKATTYAPVFLALMVMGLGAGAFKPVISGTIARCTDKTNSSLGFGIYYWSINLGAFLVPLFLVPFLKNSLGWDWVLLAAAVGTGSMILPTLTLFREPPAPEPNEDKQKVGLAQTLANAFEIIYSPIILLFAFSRRSSGGKRTLFTLVGLLLLCGGVIFLLYHSFLVLFVGLLITAALILLWHAPPQGSFAFLLIVMTGIELTLWLLPDLSLFARILCSVIALTLLALWAIDNRETEKFQDHFRFLSMVFIYSGFWVLYFQMFDSVLWYVKAYVDASSLDQAVNRLLASLHLAANWHFDVEHVTVINAGTIIVLQLLVSSLVKNTKALPTMITGIGLGTLGMAILAFSSSIWVFILGITIFSIGEMTAHPKFISYIGQIAPPERVALYMGYLFLYGVIGSSIGGVVGANLYVKFVDEMNQPKTLWLIFASIGVATVIGLLLYHRWSSKEASAKDQGTIG